MKDYNVFVSEDARILTSFLNEHARQGWKLEALSTGPTPHTDYNGDIDGTTTEAWVIISKEQSS